MQEHEKAWLACAIEGEGCISFRKPTGWVADHLKRKHRWLVTVQISNNERTFCEMAQKIASIGSIREIHRHKQNRKNTFIWMLPCRAVKPILQEIFPYFVTERKKKLAKLAIEFRSLVVQHISEAIHDDRLGEIWQEARELNKRGLRRFTTSYKRKGGSRGME